MKVLVYSFIISMASILTVLVNASKSLDVSREHIALHTSSAIDKVAHAELFGIQTGSIWYLFLPLLTTFFKI